jgi:GT2 family glycosyltransferase
VTAILSVIVGTFNRRDQLRACIDSVFAQTTVPVALHVTDAGSDDGTVEYLESRAEGCLIPVFEGRRRGQAAALNAVFARIETPYVCWLSDDNVVVNRGLDTAVGILDREHRIGMVGLKVKDVAGPFVDAPYIGGLSSLGILNVNQGVVRTRLLQAVGGFSEAFRDYGIDPDLTAKVLLSGSDVVYTRQVVIHHHRGWSPDRSSAEFALQMERQKAYMHLYRRKYEASVAGGWPWRIKKAIWSWTRVAMGLDLGSPRPVLGLLVRDWHNTFGGRFISLLDPIVCRRRPYHLRQHCPRRRLPAALPSDPAPLTQPATE